MNFFQKLEFILSGIWSFIEPFVMIFLKSYGAVLAQAALQAVSTIEQTMGTADGDAKRKAAFESILKTLESEGIKIGASQINAAIEAAVQKLKASMEIDTSSAASAPGGPAPTAVSP